MKKEVIILEDDLDIGTMMGLMLKRMGYTIQHFENVIDFQNYINQNLVSLIIMDMLLSGTDGRDICRNLKGDPLKKDIKIIMCSAHPEAAATCKEAGADAFIEKPFEMSVFIQTIQKLLS